MAMKILGLSGRKEAGKDSFARCVLRHNSDFIRIGFADRLKTLCREVFSLTDSQVNHDKETHFPDPINIDLYVPRISDKLRFPIEKRGLIAKTPRQVLQYVGTDYVRSHMPDYWITCVLNTIRQNPLKKFVITDVRFPNEASQIRELGGFVLRIVRLSQMSKVPEHVSEVLDFPMDASLAVMENNWSLPDYLSLDLSPQVFNFFDWNNLQKRFAHKNWLSKDSTNLELCAAFYYGATLVDESR